MIAATCHDSLRHLHDLAQAAQYRNWYLKATWRSCIAINGKLLGDARLQLFSLVMLPILVYTCVQYAYTLILDMLMCTMLLTCFARTGTH